MHHKFWSYGFYDMNFQRYMLKIGLSEKLIFLLFSCQNIDSR
jgi:hypothetical protein